ncbi:MAG: DUF802 domain-containing protein [Halioglobus sp.]
MSRALFAAAFFLGAAAVVWMATYFLGSDKLALSVTVVIGCVYAVGFMELLQFRRATTTLDDALAQIPGNLNEGLASLDQWFGKLDSSLRNPVRLRIEGERVGLPAPAITPYLVGLLVMLGLLGTFVGMVDTLKGAVLALEGTTELQAIRAGLAAPINGLSLAFGTSVAGVAASAMLGLTASLCRRDRMLSTRRLDNKIASEFKTFSLSHHRQETYRALQLQAQTLPEVADKLQAMAEKLEKMGDTLSSCLLENQQQFHQSVTSVYSDLATSIDNSLRTSLADSGRLAGESIKPIVAEAMQEISKEARNTHQQLTATAQEQLVTLSGRFTQTSEDVSLAWQTGLGAHEKSNEALVASMASAFDTFSEQFEQQNRSMLEAFEQSSTAWAQSQQAGDSERLEQWSNSLGQAQQQSVAQIADASEQFTTELKQVTEIQQSSFTTATGDFERLSQGLTSQWIQTGDRMDALSSTLGTELSALRDDEAQRAEAALERLAGLESTVATHLAALGTELEAPMSRLIETASETPKAAAEVIGHLRAEISNNIERDNKLLEERHRVMEDLNALSGSLEQASAGQRDAVAELVTASATMLQEVGTHFSQHVGSEVTKISEVADNFAGSTVQLSSLGDTFAQAVSLFNDSNTNLVDHLARIEASMDKSTSKSDEQMGYYVAQAREIIDQSMLSQQEVFEELRKLKQTDEFVPAEAS